MTYGFPVEVADGVHVAVSPTAAHSGSPAESRAREYEAVRVLLRRLLTQVVGKGAGRTPVAAHRSGQPYLPERPDLSISLSHSGEWVAAAVGVGPEVGVDVEVPQPAPATLLRRCCGPATLEALGRLSQQERDVEFAWIWTAQEACVKATGSGLAGRPWTIPVEVGQRTGTWHEVVWLSLRDRFRIPVSCAYRYREREAAP